MSCPVQTCKQSITLYYRNVGGGWGGGRGSNWFSCFILRKYSVFFSSKSSEEEDSVQRAVKLVQEICNLEAEGTT